MAARILGGQFLRSLIGRGLCGGPQIGIINNFPTTVQPHFSPIAFLARFGSGLGSGLGLGLRRWVGSTPVPLSAQEVLSACKR